MIYMYTVGEDHRYIFLELQAWGAPMILHVHNHIYPSYVFVVRIENKIIKNML